MPFPSFALHLPTRLLLPQAPLQYCVHAGPHLPTQLVPSRNAALLRASVSQPLSRRHLLFSVLPPNYLHGLAHQSASSSFPVKKLSQQRFLPDVFLRARVRSRPALSCVPLIANR